MDFARSCALLGGAFALLLVGSVDAFALIIRWETAQNDYDERDELNRDTTAAACCFRWWW